MKERVKLTKVEERRKNQYKDTTTFHWYNANPKGKITCDCAIRAVAAVLDITWAEAYNQMIEMSMKTGIMVNDPKLITKFIESKGFKKMSQPRNEFNKKITVKEFILHNKNYLKGKRILINAGAHHSSAIINCKVYDTWDCTWTKIGNWWVI